MLIVFEGIDGAGKSTLLDGVRKQLIAAGRPVRHWAFPSRGGIGRLVRQVFSEGTVPSARALLLLADMLHEMSGRPTNDNASVDLVDRWTVSTRVYQLDGVPLGPLRAAVRAAEALLPDPDLYVMLTIDPRVAFQRCMWRGLSGLPDPDLDRLGVYALRYEAAIADLLGKAPERVLLLDAQQAPEAMVDAVIARLSGA